MPLKRRSKKLDVRDVTVSVTWTGEADVDLVVEEPAGTVCSLQNPRTTAGGVMLGDSFAGGCQQYQRVHRDLRMPEGFQRAVPPADSSRVGRCHGRQGDGRHSDQQSRPTAHSRADSAG